MELSCSPPINPRGFDFDLLIVGEEEQRNVLENFVRENSLESNTRFLGFQKNPHALLKVSNLLSCSSRVEGFSLVVAEALVLGVPILTTYCSGPAESPYNGK